MLMQRPARMRAQLAATISACSARAPPDRRQLVDQRHDPVLRRSSGPWRSAADDRAGRSTRRTSACRHGSRSRRRRRPVAAPIASGGADRRGNGRISRPRSARAGARHVVQRPYHAERSGEFGERDPQGLDRRPSTRFGMKHHAHEEGIGRGIAILARTRRWSGHDRRESPTLRRRSRAAPGSVAQSHIGVARSSRLHPRSFAHPIAVSGVYRQSQEDRR